MTPFVRSAYNYDTDAASLESGLACHDLTLTQQQFAEECDINTILRRFGITGEVPQTTRIPLQGDFTAVVDFQSALNLVMQADEAFMQLGAETRKYFDNNPGAMLDFLSDPANREQAEKLGLTRPIVPKETAPKPWGTPTPTPAPTAAPGPV